MAKSKKATATEEFSMEEELRAIRATLEKMQASQLDFDQNIKLFTEGTARIKACRSYLDRAELMIKQLIEGENGLEESDFE